jgi:Putative beta-lactamase-inhibitor-like, PepSY-like
MKKIKYFFLPIVLTLAACGGEVKQSQDCIDNAQVPQVVQNAFGSKFAGMKACWQSKPYGFESIFTDKGIEYEAEFSSSGQWLETEYEVGEGQFSATVQEKVKQEHPGFEITKREIEITPEGTFYEVEIEGNGTEAELYFDDQGNPSLNTNEDS